MSDIVDVNTLFGPMPAAASDLNVDELIALMDKHSVRYCCTLSTVGILLDHTAGNAATRAACAETDRLIPVATINPQAYYGDEDLLPRLKSEGFRLIRLFPALQGWDVVYAPLMLIAERAAAEKFPIMVDVSRPGDPTRLLRAIGEFGVPVLLARTDESNLSEVIALLRQHEALHIETSCMVALGAIKQLVNAVGADRVLYGSGAPAQPMSSGLAVLRKSGVSEAHLAKILGGNAQRALGIG